MDSTGRRTFDPSTIVSTVSDLLTVRRVFGEAYEREGVRVIPVAKVLGGNGLGYGAEGVADPAEPHATGHGAAPGGSTGGSEGGGGGFGVRVRPVGVYVLDDHGVHWRPALDLNRVILGGQLVGIVAVVSLAWALRHRR
jgi:uncharacterized spore protein YtfJ